MIKARSAADFTGLPAIADDSGLCVDALDGAPGIYSARYCAGTDEERNAFLLRNMQDKDERACRFVCAIACVPPAGEAFTVRGECEGELLAKATARAVLGMTRCSMCRLTAARSASCRPRPKTKFPTAGARCAACVRRWKSGCEPPGHPRKTTKHKEKFFMLNTKQRAQLRALANPLADTLIIGKEGVTDAVERQLDQLLEAHELVKGKVLESAMLTPRTVAEALSEATGADTVQCIGSKFVLYRQARDKDKRKIVLVK